MPNVIGTLATIPKGLVGHLESIVVNLYVAQIQNTTLLGTARILRRVLDYYACTGNWLPVEPESIQTGVQLLFNIMVAR